MALVLMGFLPTMAYCTPPGDVSLPDTQSFTLASPETGHDYLIQVALPEAPPPAGGYPVVYLLDGNAYLPLVKVARDTLTRKGPRGPGSPLMIVAIGYPGAARFDFDQRALDYTPPHAARNKSEDVHGGADRFLAFINTRLKPEIARRFEVNPDREALFGHSFGGLFAVHVLLTAPASFNRYIAISPSLWWYGDSPVGAIEDLQRTRPDHDESAAPYVLLGAGGLEQTPDPSERGTPKARQIRARAVIDNVGAFADWLEGRHPTWSVQTTLFPGEGHGSVMWPATRRAIEFLHGQAGNKGH
ncbi:hypothetical protein RE428_41800 [Marinobacter nanhaiticus D15-8W]|nr:hypothetical protein RE428_41800 [Marinobacter nanhaiticus D15-8W]